jgi:probable HAF family extracellular repeat protein
MFMKLSVILMFTAVVTALSLTSAHAQTKYTFKDISSEMGLNGTIIGINASGAIVGTGQFKSLTKSFNGVALDEPHAFKYDGFMHDLGTFSRDRSEAYAINASGKVVGRSTADKGGMRAFLYNGGLQDLGSPGDSGAQAINSKGEVTGYILVSLTNTDTMITYSTSRAFYFDGKTMKDLSPVVGDDTIGVGIDDNGQILVQAPGKALLYSDGKAADLGSLGGGNIKPVAMSTNGKAVGSSKTDKNEIHAFLWDGTMHDLGMLPGGARSEARAVNAEGTVVGTSGGSRGRQGNDHAFVYEGSKLTDLNDLLVGDHTDLVFTDALAINDKGAIIVSSNKRDYYLLTPASGTAIKTDEQRIAAIPPPEKKVIPNGEFSGSGAKIVRNGDKATLTFTDLYGNAQSYSVERPGFAAAMLAGRDDGSWMYITDDGKTGMMLNVGASGGVSGSAANPMMIMMMQKKKQGTYVPRSPRILKVNTTSAICSS